MNSTGNDSRPAARLAPHWLLSWGAALLMFATVTVAAEIGWRSWRYRPSVADSPALWRFWYEQTLRGGHRSIVLVGASRMQAGVSTSELERWLPGHQVFQLGVYGGDSPVGVLRELARDERFSGIVICDLLEPFLRADRWDSQRDYYAANVAADAQLEAYGRALLNTRLALRSHDTGIAASAKQWLNRGRAPRPSYERMHADRAIELDFSLVDDLEALRERKTTAYRNSYEAADPFTPEQAAAALREIDSWVRQIQARGGQVVFVRMPSGGARLALEEEFHPKDQYWDTLTKATSAAMIHFQDLTGATGLKCPDDSHLDRDGAIVFSGLLAEALAERGIVANSR